MKSIVLACLVAVVLVAVTVSGDTCDYNDEVYEDGQEINIYDCATCWCKDGGIECVDVSCPNYLCPNNVDPVLKDGECCPKCP